MRTALSYRPGRDRLRSATAPAAIAFLGAYLAVCFVYPSPLVIASAGLSGALIGLAAGVRPAVLASLRWGLSVAILVIAVNALVSHRGLTVLFYGAEVPVIGQMDVTLEALVAGAVVALRLIATFVLFAVYSACVDPDRVMRMLRPVARRSALTASLVTRLVPVAAADAGRLGEAAKLRGPGAAALGRAAIARRLLAGSLDRAVDVAATLELRGYSIPARPTTRMSRRSRHDRRLYAVAAVVFSGAIGARIAGAGGFHAYPQISLDTGALTLILALALPLLALVPFAPRLRRRSAPVPAPEARGLARA